MRGLVMGWDGWRRFVLRGCRSASRVSSASSWFAGATWSEAEEEEDVLGDFVGLLCGSVWLCSLLLRLRVVTVVVEVLLAGSGEEVLELGKVLLVVALGGGAVVVVVVGGGG